MKFELKRRLAKAIATASSGDEAAIASCIEQPKNREHGDLAFPCFSLAKALKQPPPVCAANLAKVIQLPEGFDRVVALGPFLNFRFQRGAFSHEAVSSILCGQTPRKVDAPAGTKVLVEYSSPNIAKPFHVGHLRATLIGNSLDRVYRKLGYPTESINHLGDWGTQFGFVWAGCELWGKPAEATVATLVELYKKATALKEQQETLLKSGGSLAADEKDVNAIARGYFIDLERGEPYATQFWQWCLDLSLIYLKSTYARLGVSFDHYTGESFYSDKLEAVREDIERAGLLKESDGALGVELGETGGFARIATPDGRSLYLTRDLAAAKYRAETFKFTKALYVVGSPQALHFQQIKGVLEKLGCAYADAIEHVAFGHVMGMKTRGEGGAIELNHFLDEAFERSLAAYRDQVSKRPAGLDETTVATAVARAALVFSTLNRSRLKDVHFSWEHALAFQGDSGPYLLYALARVNGVKEKAIEAGLKVPQHFDATALEEEAAFELASVLADYDERLALTVADNEPAHLAAFGLEIGKAFSRAYNELKVVGEEPAKAEARLALFDATGIVLREVIELLGMLPLERM